MRWWLLAMLLVIGCSRQAPDISEPTKAPVGGIMKLSSPSFGNGGMIPAKYTCDGDEISPELHISAAPEQAKSLVLIVDDPDVPMGNWVHWLLYNIPPETTIIPEDAAITWPEGTTSFGKTGYGGPCPPSGTHRYFFKLYALDTSLNLPDGPVKEQIERAMDGHILVQAELIGRYNKD
ncbi:MAG: hypothetical protein QS99_C0009G0036 [archaeon GW2011_AR4]|nr:MAG: hypothetical protein QS99_C0009G0036 [archaeon GW2011_AR4]